MSETSYFYIHRPLSVDAIFEKARRLAQAAPGSPMSTDFDDGRTMISSKEQPADERSGPRATVAVVSRRDGRPLKVKRQGADRPIQAHAMIELDSSAGFGDMHLWFHREMARWATSQHSDFCWKFSWSALMVDVPDRLFTPTTPLSVQRREEVLAGPVNPATRRVIFLGHPRYRL